MGMRLCRAVAAVIVATFGLAAVTGCQGIGNGTTASSCQGAHSHDRFYAACDEPDHLVLSDGGNTVGEAVMRMDERESLVWNSRTWTHTLTIGMSQGKGDLKASGVAVSVQASAGGTVDPQTKTAELHDGGSKTFEFTFTSPGKSIDTYQVDLAITFTLGALSAPVNKTLGYTVRCDSEPGMYNSEGCAYPDYTPTFTLSTQGNGGEVAQHIRAAQKAMPSHWGAPSSGHPLHRTTDEALQNSNRDAKVCAGPKPTSTSQCDEYPFAATREGASQNSEWRAECTAWVSRSANLSAGASEGVFFRKSRVLDGDAFWVEITGP